MSLFPKTAAEKRLTLKDGTLELPDFMSPEMALQQLQHRLDTVAKRLRKFACVNAVIIVTPAKINEKSRSIHPGDIQYDKKHCQNDRRNGSRFCQKCADERSKAYVPREKQAPPKRVNLTRRERKKRNKHGK